MCYAISIANHTREWTRMDTQIYNTPTDVQRAMGAWSEYYNQASEQVTLTWYYMKRQDSFSNYISTGPHTG